MDIKCRISVINLISFAIVTAFSTTCIIGCGGSPPSQCPTSSSENCVSGQQLSERRREFSAVYRLGCRGQLPFDASVEKCKRDKYDCSSDNLSDLREELKAGTSVMLEARYDPRGKGWSTWVINPDGSGEFYTANYNEVDAPAGLFYKKFGADKLYDDGEISLRRHQGKLLSRDIETQYERHQCEARLGFCTEDESEKNLLDSDKKMYFTDDGDVYAMHSNGRLIDSWGNADQPGLYEIKSSWRVHAIDVAKEANTLFVASRPKPRRRPNAEHVPAEVRPYEIQALNLETGERLPNWANEGVLKENSKWSVEALEYSEARGRLYIGLSTYDHDTSTSDSQIRAVDADQGTSPTSWGDGGTHTLELPESVVLTSLKIDSTANTLVAGTAGGAAYAVNAKTGKKQGAYKPNEQFQNTRWNGKLKLSTEHDLIYISHGSHIHAVDMKKLETAEGWASQGKYKESDIPVSSMALSKDGKRLYVSYSKTSKGDQTEMHAVSPNTGKQLENWGKNGKASGPSYIRPLPVQLPVSAPDGEILYTIGPGSGIYRFEADAGQLMTPCSGSIPRWYKNGASRSVDLGYNVRNLVVTD